MRRPFTLEEDQLLLALVKDGGGTNAWSEWVDQFDGRSRHSIRMRYREHLATGEPMPLAHFRPEFLDVRHPEPPDWRKILSVAKQGQELAQDADGTQRIATVRIEGPALLCYSACWHLGGVAVDYVSWRRHIDLIMDTPACYMVMLGDAYENMRSFHSLEAVLSQVLPVAQQARALEGIVTELCDKGKLLAMVEGNHEIMDERIFGEALIGYIYRHSTAPQFPNRGLLKLGVTCDGVEYQFPTLLFHKSRYRSFLNSLHGAKREYQLSFPGRIVAGAHDHKPGIEYYWHHGLMRQAGYGLGGRTILIKAGTFNQGKFGWRFWGGDPPVMPCVLFWHDYALAFPSLEIGVFFLNQARNAGQISDELHDVLMGRKEL